MKILFLTIAVFISFMLNSSLAFAACQPKPVDMNIENADIIFMGKVLKKRSVSEKKMPACFYAKSRKESCGSKVAVFDVSHTWKGAISGRYELVHSIDSCYCPGLAFKEDNIYIIFGYRTEQDYGLDVKYTVGTVCEGSVGLQSYENNPLRKYLNKYFNEKRQQRMQNIKEERKGNDRKIKEIKIEDY